MKTNKGILLVNLGTPDSPRPRDVYHYLLEFLMDGRVIDIPWISRQLLVRTVIVPFRYRQSARSYQQIWSEKGSPLKIYGYRLQQQLQERLGDSFHVELAMRYRTPSIPEALKRLQDSGIEKLLIFPLFPHYASATTGSVYQKVMEEASKWEVIPELIFAGEYATHPELIAAFCAAAASYDLGIYDHILFSFHGLPQRHIRKADRGGYCLKSSDCCQQRANPSCYSSQCVATAKAIAAALHLPVNQYSVSFQSRLGKDPWLQPYTSEVITSLAKQGKRKVLVFCPSFVCDCLETIFEIGIEGAEEFRHAGGEQIDLVPGLNDHPRWLEALEFLVKERLRI